MTMTSLPRVVPDGDFIYDMTVSSGQVLHVEADLSELDSAFVLGACHERGVPVGTAVTEALVAWAQA